MSKVKTKKYIIYFLSFFIPFAIAFLVFYSNNISGYPFHSTNTILVYDLDYEMVPMYSYLSDLGNGFNNLFFTTSTGIGGDFFGGYVLYVSPFDFIYSLVPLLYLPDAVFWMTITKIGLSGLCFFIFLKNSRKTKISDYFSLVFSSCYALMSYNFTFHSMPMASDLVFLFPILALLVERLAFGEASFLFVFLLFFTIIDCYYIAYMVVIALCVFFLFNLLESKTDCRFVLHSCLRFIYHLILSVCLAGFVLIPVIFNLLGGKLSDSSSILSVPLIINTPLEIFRSMFSMNYSDLGLNQTPNIFCGSVIVVLIVLYLISKEKIRTKLMMLLTFAVYFVSFVFGYVDSAWHGFSVPYGYSSRYSFTFCFFVLYFSGRYLSLNPIARNSGIVKYKKLICFTFTFFTYIELFLNDSYLISCIQEEYTYKNRNEYARYLNVISDTFTYIRDDGDKDIYRCEKNFISTNVDGMMYGYNDLMFFNSNYNSDVMRFLKKAGLLTHYNMISNSGLTPPLASLLNVKYFVNYYKDSLDCYELIDTYNSYYVLRNNYAFPISFLSKGTLPNTVQDFSEDPFENINLIYQDLFMIDDPVFVSQDFSVVENISGDSNENTNRLDFSFVPQTDGFYFFYRKNETNPDIDIQNMNMVSNLLNYYVNGDHFGDYGLNIYRYCASLGHLNAGEKVTVSLDVNPSDCGQIFLYRCDTDLLYALSQDVTGFEVAESGWRGMILHGYTDDDRDLVMTIPYERGYNISINGEKAEYDSYRDTFLVLHLDKGNNEIRINYIPYGFKAGLVCSLIGIILSFIVFHKKRNTIK